MSKDANFSFISSGMFAVFLFVAIALSLKKTVNVPPIYIHTYQSPISRDEEITSQYPRVKNKTEAMGALWIWIMNWLKFRENSLKKLKKKILILCWQNRVALFKYIVIKNPYNNIYQINKCILRHFQLQNKLSKNCQPEISTWRCDGGNTNENILLFNAIWHQY